VRIISRRTLIEFWDHRRHQKDYKGLKASLESWYHEVRKAQWRNSSDVKKSYATASIITSDRVVFNIKGNDYRLVTYVDYPRQWVFVKWIGSHKDYDNIEARKVEYEN
jgi:mRNA interferase HigB